MFKIWITRGATTTVMPIWADNFEEANSQVGAMLELVCGNVLSDVSYKLEEVN